MSSRLTVAFFLALAATTTACNNEDDAALAADEADASTEAADPGASKPPAGEDGGKVPDGGAPAAAAPMSGGETHNGSLAQGDNTLESGEYVDFYPIEVEAGQTIEVELTTQSFDPYLIVRPEGAAREDQVENDDYPQGDRRRSRVEHTATRGGTWQVLATSYEAGEEGAYTLTISTNSAGAGGSSKVK